MLVLRSAGGVLDVVVSPALFALGRKPCLTPPVILVSVPRQNGLTPTRHPSSCLSDGHALLALLPGAPLLPSVCLCVPLYKTTGVCAGGGGPSWDLSSCLECVGGCGARCAATDQGDGTEWVGWLRSVRCEGRDVGGQWQACLLCACWVGCIARLEAANNLAFSILFF